MTQPKLKVVACIPAHNEEMTIAKVIVKTMMYVDEVIVCDDGSMDMSGEIARKLGAEVIVHDSNLGYGAALADLFLKSSEHHADIVVTIDSDGQHNSADIPKLIKPIIDGEADVTIGSRFLGGSDETPPYRKVGIKIITGMTNRTNGNGGMAVSDAQSGLRAYSRKALERIAPIETGMGASTEILMKANESGLRIVEVPITIDYDAKAPSASRSLSQGLEVAFGTFKHISMNHPLTFYGVPGVLAIAIAAVFWVWTLNVFAETKSIITNVAIVAVGTTIVGLMLLLTAIVLWVMVSMVKEENSKWEKRLSSMRARE